MAFKHNMAYHWKISTKKVFTLLIIPSILIKPLIDLHYRCLVTDVAKGKDSNLLNISLGIFTLVVFEIYKNIDAVFDVLQNTSESVEIQFLVVNYYKF